MTALFGNIAAAGVEEAQDRVGGFRVYDTDAYKGTIKALYAGKSSSSNAASVSIIMALDAGGEYRETFWITNGKGEAYYTKDGKKFSLPGYIVVDDICQVTVGKSITEMVAEEKVINLYNSDQKKEIPTGVQMFTEALGKELILGILKETKNKQVKDGNGNYVDTADSRDENVTDKVFHVPSQMTMVEARKGDKAPKFYGVWTETNRGKTRDRRTIKDGASAQGGRNGRPNGAGGPPKSDGAAAAKTSLFNT